MYFNTDTHDFSSMITRVKIRASKFGAEHPSFGMVRVFIWCQAPNLLFHKGVRVLKVALILVMKIWYIGAEY